jgi:hypothetical protein
MWVLLISAYLHLPLAQTQSKGVLQLPQQSLEQCERERDRVRATWYTDGYRISSRCVYIKYYSTNNGAYNESNK